VAETNAKHCAIDASARGNPKAEGWVTLSWLAGIRLGYTQRDKGIRSPQKPQYFGKLAESPSVSTLYKVHCFIALCSVGLIAFADSGLAPLLRPGRVASSSRRN
jgi:hypothetical protein